MVRPPLLGQLYHCITALSEKQFFLVSILNLPWHCGAIPSCPVTVTWELRCTVLAPRFLLQVWLCYVDTGLEEAGNNGSFREKYF